MRQRKIRHERILRGRFLQAREAPQAAAVAGAHADLGDPIVLVVASRVHGRAHLATHLAGSSYRPAPNTNAGQARGSTMSYDEYGST